jgi:hypothetical protein
MSAKEVDSRVLAAALNDHWRERMNQFVVDP